MNSFTCCKLKPWLFLTHYLKWSLRKCYRIIQFKTCTRQLTTHKTCIYIFSELIMFANNLYNKYLPVCNKFDDIEIKNFSRTKLRLFFFNSIFVRKHCFCLKIQSNAVLETLHNFLLIFERCHRLRLKPILVKNITKLSNTSKTLAKSLIVKTVISKKKFCFFF